jgi:hypothetical protein
MKEGYKNCLSQMREEQRLRVFENKVLRTICGGKEYEEEKERFVSVSA